VLYIKVGNGGEKEGYFQYDTVASHTTNEPHLLYNIWRGTYVVHGHDGAESICQLKVTSFKEPHHQDQWPPRGYRKQRRLYNIEIDSRGDVGRN